MGIIELITAALGAAKEALGFASKRSDLRNAPDMKAATVAQREADARAKTAKAIKDGNIKEIRNELAE